MVTVVDDWPAVEEWRGGRRRPVHMLYHNALNEFEESSDSVMGGSHSRRSDSEAGVMVGGHRRGEQAGTVSVWAGCTRRGTGSHDGG